MIELLKVDQVAELLHCEAETVALHCKNGTLPGLKYGRCWLIPAEALNKFLNEVALEQARERHRDFVGSLAASGQKARPARPLAPIPAQSGRGRRARVPPPLPRLPSESP